jgi:Uncharacterized conserved protein (DUF2075)
LRSSRRIATSTLCCRRGPTGARYFNQFVDVERNGLDVLILDEAVSDQRFDGLVRNVYKVLLTRGMKGTAIYSVDPVTRRALHHLVGT